MTYRDPDIGQVRQLLGGLVVPPGAPKPPIEQQRAEYDGFGASIPLPEGCEAEVITAGGVPAQRLTPRGADKGKALLYLHGGGYVIGSAISHAHMVARLAEAAGVVAINLDYRLAPEHLFPAAVEDAVAAYGWMLDQGWPASRIVIAGDSAGGGLTLATAVALKAKGLPQPAGLYPISPWADLSQSGGAYQTKGETDPIVNLPSLTEMSGFYRGDASASDPLVSPLFADLSGLAPILIHVGSEEVLLTDATGLAERAALAGVAVRLEVWPEMIHVWPFFHAMLVAGRRAIDEAGAWIRGQVTAS